MPSHPPKRFKPAGEIFHAEWSEKAPDFVRRPARKGRRGLGVKYEKKGHVHFQELLGDAYIPSPWLMFNEYCGGRIRWCQPDALYIDVEAGEITIIEFKYQHTSGAWWQIIHLYEPVLRKLFPHFQFRHCEVVKWYDPAADFPVRVTLAPDVTKVPLGKFGVHIWKP